MGQIKELADACGTCNVSSVYDSGPIASTKKQGNSVIPGESRHFTPGFVAVTDLEIVVYGGREDPEK
jgi:hypothetical protein